MFLLRKQYLLQYSLIGRARPTEVTPHTGPAIGWFEPQSFFHWFARFEHSARVLKFGSKDAHS